MLLGKHITVIMPAYNAEKTIEKSVRDLPGEIVDQIILVDDASSDNTIKVAEKLNLKVFRHKSNYGYGRNQKTCYKEAISLESDIIVMVHPDYQYDPKLVLPMASMIACGTYDVVLASRILGGGALKGGMPLYKYVANRILTLFQNIAQGCKLSEYHTGYRAFSRKVLETLPLEENSDNFIFDNQMIAQIVHFGFKIGEISCPTRYFEEASSIKILPSIIYGLGVIETSIKFFLNRHKLSQYQMFSKDGRKLNDEYYSVMSE